MKYFFQDSKKPKIAIVVQGPSLYVEEVKNAWKDFKKDLIFSTWKGSEYKYNSTDIVIFNDTPKSSGYYNFNLQKISSYNGLLKAKELGYTYALKIRSDYLPTNAKNLISILKFDKINYLLWEFTSFLWLTFPTLPGYFTDHLIFGPINEMIELWDIKYNFCSSQTMLTWSYINKLRDKIDVHYLLPELNENNDLFYIKSTPNCELFGFYSYNNNFSERNLKGRYESYFQNFRINSRTGKSEYTSTPEETKKLMNDNYLNFLKYFNPLPKITIFNNTNNHRDFTKIIYPKNKLEIVSTIEDITSDYVISSEKLIDNSTIMIEFFKKNNTFYDGTYQKYNQIDQNTIEWVDPGNFNSSGYKLGSESIYESNLLTKEEFLWNQNQNLMNLDFLEIGTSNDALIKYCNNDNIGICIDHNKNKLNNLSDKKGVLKINKSISGDKIINRKIRIENKYVDLVNIIDFLKEKKIKKIKYLQIELTESVNILNDLLTSYQPENIRIKNNISDDILKTYYDLGYELIYKNSNILLKKQF